MLFQDYLIEHFDYFFDEFKKKNRLAYESKYHPSYVSIKGYEQDLKFRKDNLISSIKSKSFRFSNLYPIVVENKKNPEKLPRLICIPTIQDRLVQMILIKYLAEYCKDDLAMLKSSDFAVEGLGVIEARKKALSLISFGKYILKTDISSFFDNLDRNLLIKDFKETLPNDLFYLFDSVVCCDCSIPNDYNSNAKAFIRSKLNKGVRQGMPLSPLIASFYLSEFDEWLKQENFKHVRYADDLIFFLDNEDECKTVFYQIEAKLKEIQLSLPQIGDNSKTQIVKPFAEVTFLGLSLRYENQKYDWFIPAYVIKNVEESLMNLTKIDNNIKNNLSFIKTVIRMNQIVIGYEHCFKDAEPKNLKDFKYRLKEVQASSLDLLFKNLGIDISRMNNKHKDFLIGNIKKK